MMHLSREQLMEAAEGRAERRDQRTAVDGHLEECGACRREVAGLRATLRDAAALPVPEPSPLFWEHFSARVSAAVQAQEVPVRRAPRGWPLSWRTWPTLAGAVAVALLVGVLAWQWGGAAVPAPASARGGGRTADVMLPGRVPDDDAGVAEPGGEDASWSVLTSLLAEGDTSGVLSETPGSAEGAMLQLSDEERGELGRLLRTEIERHGAQPGA